MTKLTFEEQRIVDHEKWMAKKAKAKVPTEQEMIYLLVKNAVFVQAEDIQKQTDYLSKFEVNNG